MDGSASSTAIGLAPARLLLTPATAMWTLPFGAYLILLSGRVVYLRVRTKTALGDDSSKSRAATKNEAGKEGANKTDVGKAEPTTGERNASGEPDPIYLANRCLGSYLETVPIVMIFSLIAELNGADHRVINFALGALLLAKVTHVELGLRRPRTVGLGRPIGHASGLSLIAGMAGYCAYLAKDYWLE